TPNPPSSVWYRRVHWPRRASMPRSVYTLVVVVLEIIASGAHAGSKDMEDTAAVSFGSSTRDALESTVTLGSAYTTSSLVTVPSPAMVSRRRIAVAVG